MKQLFFGVILICTLAIFNITESAEMPDIVLVSNSHTIILDNNQAAIAETVMGEDLNGQIYKAKKHRTNPVRYSVSIYTNLEDALNPLAIPVTIINDSNEAQRLFDALMAQENAVPYIGA